MLEAVAMLLTVLIALAGTFFAVAVLMFALIVAEVVWAAAREQYQRWFH